MHIKHLDFYFFILKNGKTNNIFLTILLLLIFLFPKNLNAQCPPSATRLYVNKNVVTAGDGTSWTNAYAEFREALLLAHDCPDIEEIWVAEGTYVTSAVPNRLISYVMRNNLAWYGGFDGTENNLEERDWNAHPTILSGDIFEDDDYATMPPTNNDENSFHVIFNFINGIDSSAIMDGFHIVGGNANIDPPNHVGGGLYNKQTSPTVVNCSFYGNNGGYGGGGNYNDLSTISLDNCIFYNNTGTFRGGGMYSDASTMVMNNCTFFNNHTLTPDSAVGGAMFNNFSNPRINNCSFFNNSSSHGGDAISNNAWSKPFIRNSIFWGNGDEIVNTSSDPNFASPEENSNNTVRIQNCIIQNSNGSGSGWNLFYGIDDGGNFDDNPLFVDETIGDLRLQECSPAVNSGDNFLIPQGLLIDLDGNDRIYDFTNGGVVDLGAFEFQATPNCCTVGEPCDDNDVCTTGETLQDDCNCGGGILTDADADNICDSDAADNCIGPNIGDACDDGNTATVNDTINIDCICIGVDPDFCPDLNLNIGDSCDDNDDCTVGEFVQSDCTCSGGTLLDNDMDGLCDTDLEDNCFGPNIGAVCDDGDSCTVGETVQQDCTCGGSTLLDVDGDLICDLDAADNCFGPNVGDTCDDGDPCTIDESIQQDCNCGGGTLLDMDGDLICDLAMEDNCDGPNIGDICDDGNVETENDMVNSDCICDGVVSNFNLENEKISLHLFPNPVDDVLFLEIKNAGNQKVEVQIFNQLGQLISTKNVNQLNATPLFFEVKNYERGVYFMQVKLENGSSINEKFIVF